MAILYYEAYMFWRKTTKVKYDSQCIIWRVHAVTMMLLLMVTLLMWLKAVFARILSCEVACTHIPYHIVLFGRKSQSRAHKLFSTGVL
jgi:hypothetical protein